MHARFTRRTLWTVAFPKAVVDAGNTRKRVSQLVQVTESLGSRRRRSAGEGGWRISGTRLLNQPGAPNCTPTHKVAAIQLISAQDRSPWSIAELILRHSALVSAAVPLASSRPSIPVSGSASRRHLPGERRSSSSSSQTPLDRSRSIAGDVNLSSIFGDQRGLGLNRNVRSSGKSDGKGVSFGGAKQWFGVGSLLPSSFLIPTAWI